MSPEKYQNRDSSLEIVGELIGSLEKRVYTYFRIAEPDKLIELQENLPKTQLELFNPETFHLTYIHFGKPTELYNEISKYTDITLEDFLRRFHRFLDITEESPLEITAPIIMVHTFGSFNNPVIAAVLDLPQDAHIARECYLDWLDEEIILTKNSWESSRQSNIINWKPGGDNSPYSDYYPHITIARSEKPLSSPISFEPAPMKIRLDGIYVER